MVKPLACAGSKGINKIYSADEYDFAFNDAMKYSRCKRLVVEEFIEKKGYQVSGDGFTVDGKLVFRCFGNEFYSDNGIKEYVPLGECWPSVLDKATQDKIHDELQRLITELGMKTGAYNIEVILDKDDNVYILELGARNGGSLIPQITQYATGVDMVEYTIKAALGEDCSDIHMVEPTGFWSNYMVHSKKTGKLVKVNLADEINFVSKFPNLEELYVQGNKLTDVAFTEHLPNLRKLDITGNYVTDLRPLGKLNNLDTVWCGENTISTGLELGDKVNVVADSKVADKW